MKIAGNGMQKYNYILMKANEVYGRRALIIG
jgi:hypothetical protein